MKKLLFFVGLIVLPAFSCLPQLPGKIQLKVGDTVPNIEFSDVINSTTSNLQLSSFTKKIIILDFWASWCGTCINLFTHMDSLQREFNDSLQIILVNTRSKESHDDEQKIKKIISRLESRTGQTVKLPIIYNCETLDNYFPSKYVPHEVWLDKNKKVIAITSWMEVTEQNIQALLNNMPVSLHTKEDILDYDKDKPLFVSNNRDSSLNFTGRSIVTGYKEGVYGTITRTSAEEPGKVIGLSLLNNPLQSILQTAYAGTGKLDFANNRWLYEVKDKKQYEEHNDSSYYDYLYCYDITIPATSMENLRKYIRQDLERYFNITVRTEKRKLDCYVLKYPSKVKFSHSIKTEEIEYEEGSQKKYMYGSSLSEVIKFFDLRLARPLLNETSISLKRTIDIDLPNNLKDEQALLRSLKKAGFRIVKEKRTVEVVIISDM